VTGTEVPEVEVPEIEVDDAARRVEAGAVLLDVREPDEWHAGHVVDARWIPMDAVAARQDELPTDEQLVVVCKSGGRSRKVVAALVQAGYDAASVVGGLKAWEAQGLPLVTDDGAPGVVA